MPLDADDIEKITTIVERSTNRIEEDLKSYMPRIEYESRHSDLYNRTVKNSTDLEAFVRWAMGEHEKIIIRLDSRFDIFSNDIASLRKEISDGRGTTIRYIISVIIGLALGIVIPLLVKFLGG